MDDQGLKTLKMFEISPPPPPQKTGEINKHFTKHTQKKSKKIFIY